MGNQSSRKAGESASMSSSQQVSHTHARRSSDTSALIHGSTHLAVSQSQAQYNNKTSIGGGPTTPNPAAAGSHGAAGAQNYPHHSSTLDDTALLNTTGRAGSASTASAAQAAATAMSRSMHGVYQVDDDNVAGGYTRKRSNTLDIMGMRNINSGIEIPTGTNRKGVLPTVVRWKGGGKNVFIAGSFNNWKAKIPMVKSQNDFMMIIELPEGKHEYKFWVDGQWVHDPTANAVVNQYGSKHNYIDVKKSDFEVFEALEKDSEKAPKKEHNESFQTGSPPDSEYSQEIASRRIYDQTSGPPILPPHLRDVILNQNLPADYEPNLLPEPTHVMLNHMYALSIKDGVMVLSTTHRYRKKYVTTLLYKPIS